MRSETILLMTEDIAGIDGLHDEWDDCYRPQTPGGRALLDRCVYYTAQFHHIAARTTAAINENIRAAPLVWEQKQQQAVDAPASLIDDDPAAARAGLFGTAAGCRHLLALWAPLVAVLDEDGCWYAPTHRDRALRLLGWKPEDVGDESVFLLALANHCAQERPDPAHLAWYLDVANMPDTLIRRLITEGPPDRASAIAMLRAWVDKELTVLRECEAYLRETIEEPSRAEAPTRAKGLEGEAARLTLRYLQMNDAAFHRAHKALVKGEQGAAEVEERAEAVEVEVEVEAPDEARARASAFIAGEQAKVDQLNAEAAAAKAGQAEVVIEREVPSAAEAAPNKARSAAEAAPNKARSAPEPAPNKARSGGVVAATRAASGPHEEWDPESPLSPLAALMKSIAVREAREKAEAFARPSDEVGSVAARPAERDEGAGGPSGGGGGVGPPGWGAACG